MHNNSEHDPVSGSSGTQGKPKVKLKPTAAFYGLICVILGIIDLINPEKMLSIIAYAIGISAIVCGIIFVIRYMVRDVRYNMGNNDFLSGIVAAVIGVIILIKWQELMALVPMILGVFIIVSGCIKLQDCIDLKKLGNSSYAVMLVMALVFIIFGAVLVSDPFESEVLLLRLIGVSLIISGMTDIFASIFFDSIRKNYMLQDIETTYTEESTDTGSETGNEKK
ncbi:MAG: DUF308 domain-containing protein [Lachnospiraceae bacterium]|nr:DUF308 domain-containing protein [Lachnospiraceae bacterium]MBP1586048.1 DUF308 domain-containing protein [Lachnospiraceae bacterium]